MKSHCQVSWICMSSPCWGRPWSSELAQTGPHGAIVRCKGGPSRIWILRMDLSYSRVANHPSHKCAPSLVTTAIHKDIHTMHLGPGHNAASFASNAQHWTPCTCARKLLSVPFRYEMQKTMHENVMPKYVALPCPPQPIVAHNTLVLDDIAWVHHKPENVEIEQVPPKLAEEKWPW